MVGKYEWQKEQVSERRNARSYEANRAPVVKTAKTSFSYPVLLALLLASFLLVFTACQSNEALKALVATDPAITTLNVPIDQMSTGNKMHSQLSKQSNHIDGDCDNHYAWESTGMKKFEDRLLQLQMRGKGYIMYFNPKFFRLR